MSPNVASFLQKIAEDTAFKARIEAAPTAEEGVAIAQAEGIPIEVAELREAFSTVSDEDLDGVAGGNPMIAFAGETVLSWFKPKVQNKYPGY